MTDAGKISHAQALEKAKEEYRKFQAQTLSPVEDAYLATMQQVNKLVADKVKSGKT